MKKIPLTVSFADNRGTIIDMIENETIHAVTLITFTPGAVRANHYHRETIQWNYVLSGRIRLVSQFPGEAPEETVMGPGDFVATMPNESHALQGLEESQLLVLTKGPRGGKEYESDTFRLETPLIAP
ncbi:MAG TPA: cupin domain-containing protein [Spirochaetota bacterium]|nr:cupin domain-containing protein [Spirochaetota bacterium]HNT11667.1 cupin domain-containing protein [Spirochaetota bacterium]